MIVCGTIELSILFEFYCSLALRETSIFPSPLDTMYPPNKIIIREKKKWIHHQLNLWIHCVCLACDCFWYDSHAFVLQKNKNSSNWHGNSGLINLLIYDEMSPDLNKEEFNIIQQNIVGMQHINNMKHSSRNSVKICQRISPYKIKI